MIVAQSSAFCTVCTSLCVYCLNDSKRCGCVWSCTITKDVDSVECEVIDLMWVGGDVVWMDLKFAAHLRSLAQLLDIDFQAAQIASVLMSRKTQHEDILTYKSHAIETAASERESVSCTCEYLGAQVSGHHGNPPHLSATAAESSRRTHTNTAYERIAHVLIHILFVLSSRQSHFSCLLVFHLLSPSPSFPSTLLVSSLCFLTPHAVHSLQSVINEGGSYTLQMTTVLYWRGQTDEQNQLTLPNFRFYLFSVLVKKILYLGVIDKRTSVVTVLEFPTSKYGYIKQFFIQKKIYTSGIILDLY